MKRADLIEFLKSYLEIEKFKDYAPNGLQIAGTEEINLIVLAVTASGSSVNAAVAMGAQALLVHHGWFWKSEPAPIVGIKYQRIAKLIKNDVNLMAYHLPLDAHPAVGNNAQLAERLSIRITDRIGDLSLLHVGELIDGPMKASDFAERVERVLGRKPLLAGDPDKFILKIGWCSGAAQNELLEAADAGCDLYLSGEIREATPYEAVESGCVYLAGGHYATERFGIQALGELLMREFPGLECRYVELDNPA